MMNPPLSGNHQHPTSAAPTKNIRPDDAPSSSSTTDKQGRRHRVLALYKFVTIPSDQIRPLQNQVQTFLLGQKARGTILLAKEGINGTICYPSISSPVYESTSAPETHMDMLDTHRNKNEEDPILQYFHQHLYFAGMKSRLSYAETPIFHRLKVKIKREIVTMLGQSDREDDEGGEGEEMKQTKPNDISNIQGTSHSTTPVIKPAKVVGQYIPPGKEWDDLLMDPNVLVIDTRNQYEVDIGTFENAISPQTDNFRQFPEWIRLVSEACTTPSPPLDNTDHDSCTTPSSSTEETPSSHPTYNCRSTQPIGLHSFPSRFRNNPPKAVAMFCTGGIRCEKSTSYCITEQIFPSHIPIYHLEGGILAYLEKHPDPSQSKWKGDCFVFDHRVAVTHGLVPSPNYELCFACRRPLAVEDRQGQDYVHGVCCKHCRHEYSDEDRERFANRQKQVLLAKKRGLQHIYDPKENDVNTMQT